jgi:hypothetical protein
VSWEDNDGLERGGACNECGEPVEEAHHAYCADCYVAQPGWNRPRERPDADALRWQHADRVRTVTSLLIERLDKLELRAARSAEQIEALERRVERLERAGDHNPHQGRAA